MGHISLPSNLNAIISITSYCVLLKMVILHYAIKQFRMGFYCFFVKKKDQENQKPGFERKPRSVVIFKKTFFSSLIIFQSFFQFFLDRTLWNKSHH